MYIYKLGPFCPFYRTRFELLLESWKPLFYVIYEKFLLAPKSVRLTEGFPEILVENGWHPICGHYFWNNNFGARLFCQELGFNDGKIVEKKILLDKETYWVGECKESDKNLKECSGRCTLNTVGGTCRGSKCLKGEKTGIRIECL